MVNLLNPENAGERLRALVEFIIPTRQRVIGEAILNMERTVSNFDQANSTTANSSIESVKYVAIEEAKKPESIVAKQDIVKSSKTKRTTIKSPSTNLSVSTARANLSAIYSSTSAGERK